MDMTATAETQTRYGQACQSCARLKTKCLWSQALTNKCDRCQRLGQTCEPSVSVRSSKRKKYLVDQQGHFHGVSDGSPERRSGSIDKLPIAHKSSPNNVTDLAYVLSAARPRPLTPSSSDADDSSATIAKFEPDLALDTQGGFVEISRPANVTGKALSGDDLVRSLIQKDLANIDVLQSTADLGIDLFRQAFIPQFPFLHLPDAPGARELRAQKPFVWLNIIALTSKDVERQFELEEVIWQVVTLRIIREHHVSLDLLLGLICFASWNHYYKQDKPFMTMLSNLAVTMAMELNLHRTSTQALSSPLQDPIEECRAYLALYHLTSTTWTMYRKTEPLRWTRHLTTCLNRLTRDDGHVLDRLLALQVRCLRLSNRLTCRCDDTPEELRSDPMHSTDHMLRDLKEAETLYSSVALESVPTQASRPSTILCDLNEIIARSYLTSTEAAIRTASLDVSEGREHDQPPRVDLIQEMGLAQVSNGKWMQNLLSMTSAQFIGVTVDVFSQFTRALVLQYKLDILNDGSLITSQSTNEESDVFTMLDSMMKVVLGLPKAVGLIDAKGLRKGLVFKTPALLSGIRMLFEKALSQRQNIRRSIGLAPNLDVTSRTFETSNHYSAESQLPTGFLEDLAAEPWVSDIFGSSWTSMGYS